MDRQMGPLVCLLVRAIVMGFWLFVIGGLLMQYGQHNSVGQPYTWIARPVGWMYPPEIVPLRIRAKSVSLVTVKLGLQFSHWESLCLRCCTPFNGGYSFLCTSGLPLPNQSEV
ncbi:hypothetical protein V1505DRAFT_380251 [Lipomyces doorenjongii]